jgi:uncharacterized protein YdeI (YjbR/CyaY-like superfamily)
MGTRDPRIDAYIAKAQPFARPILERLRELVHTVCPTVEETIKWGFPHFQYNGMLCSMASFKAHAVFGFWRGKVVVGEAYAHNAMGDYGRFTSVADLPSSRVLTAHLRKAMALNDAGAKTSTAMRPARAAKAELAMPEALQVALDADPAARLRFDAFPPSHRREYIEWIVDAKREETRARRVAQAVEWIAQGKGRNWKYDAPTAAARPQSAPKARPPMSKAKTGTKTAAGTARLAVGTRKAAPASAARKKPAHTTAARGSGGRGR